MDRGETSQVEGIIEQVRGWPPESRVVLARRILETLEPTTTRPQARGARSVRELIGMGAGGSPPPDDEAVRRWIDEHRAEKYR